MHYNQNLNKDSKLKNLLVLCGLFATFIALGMLNSVGWSLTSTVGKGVFDVNTLIGCTLFLALCAVFVWALQSPERLSYLLGASAALGVFPTMPKLPFLQDVTHVLLVLFIAANWRSFRTWRGICKPFDSRLVSLFVFLLTAVVSVIFNFLQRGDIWQLKVGLSSLLLLVILFLALCIIVATPATISYNQLRKGFLESAQIIAALGLAAIALLLITPYSTGFDGSGQNTLGGLAYFDRMKLLFSGPTVAASYFIGAMSFAVYILSENNGAIKGWARARLLFLLQVSPWLIMATGSRIGKIALVILILTGLSWKSLRRVTLTAIPITLISFFISLDFQSLPSAVMFHIGFFFPEFVDTADLEKLRMGKRFLMLGERGVLMQQAFDTFREATWLNKSIGMGFGTTGYSTSSYPSPHNQIFGLIAQVGVLGLASFLVFWGLCSWRIFVSMWQYNSSDGGESWAFFICLISFCGLSVAYESTMLGWVLTLLLMIFSWEIANRKK